ncbi:HDOD domain-containing protein [Marinobacter sp. JSM 1782161]|uniref:HDOD domain-containing protein n=1 Tax=Marinobacter sp. JSM 1782161 TaxID=2685906 RepID=UPI001D195290|nr:HDOD domain-containing protein [Marinobacter sp. JSM 1782161]
MSESPVRLQSTQAWVDYLSQVELPVLANTLRRINHLTASNNSTVSELAAVILNDAQLTSQVLRLSNSAFYNHSRVQVSTVSRAITLIGFDAVKSMAISSLLIDSLIQRNPRPHLLKALARALHAAVQARCLLPGNSEQAHEEAFIGALLTNIGELAFWSCPTDQASELAARLPADKPAELQQEILGTTFVEITRGLVESWKLGRFIQDVVSAGRASSPAVALVRESVELAREAENGWRSKAVDKRLARIAAAIGEQPASVRDQVRLNAGEAEEIAVSFGIPQIRGLLPGSNDADSHETPQAPQGDPTLQLSILRDISAALATQPDLNGICQMVVEGIHRAVGLRRVALLMADRTGTELVPRKRLGSGTDAWADHFMVNRDGAGDLQCLLTDQCALIEAGDRPLLPDCDAWIGTRPALVGPLFAGPRRVGLFYADNGDLQASLSDDQLVAFSHFVQQAQLCISLLAR